jgi:plasmid stability protein
LNCLRWFDITDIKAERALADLLIRNLPSALRRQLQERAKKNHHSLSEEAKTLIQRGLAGSEPPMRMGTFLFSLFEDKYRGDDLVFERADKVRAPPKFE